MPKPIVIRLVRGGHHAPAGGMGPALQGRIPVAPSGPIGERVTQVTRRSLLLTDNNARVTQVTRRTMALPDNNARVTQVTRRVLGQFSVATGDDVYIILQGF